MNKKAQIFRSLSVLCSALVAIAILAIMSPVTGPLLVDSVVGLDGIYKFVIQHINVFMLLVLGLVVWVAFAIFGGGND